MEFFIPCGCGRRVPVSEGDAGAAVGCECGLDVKVPTLKELRLAAGLPPYEVSPELLVEDLLARGEVPTGRSCVGCGAETDDVVYAVVECERAWRKRPRHGWLGLVAAFFSPLLGLAVLADAEGEMVGEDKIYHLPLTACPVCRKRLRNPADLKGCLERVPVYRWLLLKFPEAGIGLGRT
jgi:hypothetical protein